MSNCSNQETLFISLLNLFRQDQQTSRNDALDPECWPSMVNLASRQGLVPLLYWNLVKNHTSSDLPQGVAQTLRSEYYRCLANNTRLYHELDTLLHEFNQQGIKVLLLKGVYLAEFIFQNLALRPMVDLDIMVQRNDLQRAIDIQKKLTNTNAGERTIPNETSRNQRFRPSSLIEESNTDLHWTLAVDQSSLLIDEQGLWSRSQPVVLSGVTAYALSLEDLILHICIHASYLHLFINRGRSLLDLREILVQKGNQVNWSDLFDRARIWKAERGLFIMLYLVKEYLAVPVPEEILIKLRPDTFSQQIVEEVIRMFVSQKTPVSLRLTNLINDTSLLGKARTLRETLLPDKAEVYLQYSISNHSWLIFFYYPRMIFDRFIRHLPTIRKLTAGDKSISNQLSDTYSIQSWLNQQPAGERTSNSSK